LLPQMPVRGFHLRLQCSLQHMHLLFYQTYYSNDLFLLAYDLVAFITYTYSSLGTKYVDPNSIKKFYFYIYNTYTSFFWLIYCIIKHYLVNYFLITV
jgi:hypothetical protein